ncbi:MAG TPA: histidinol-phosphate transaminase [Xanthobacteraceae bacterium]|nr:histidinol-phosphate transaminase [Xanthobacteraceae bacterium]
MPFPPKEHLRSIARTSERHEGRAGFIRLDRNERVSPIPEARFREMLARLSPEDVMSYPDAGPFVSRLADHLGFPQDQIAETAGSDAALRRVFMAYLKPGAGVVTLNPSYAMYDLYTRIFQGVSRRIDYPASRVCDVEALLAAIEPGVGLVIIAHPDQPVGTAMAMDDVRRVVARAARVGAVCLVDEAYHPFYPVTALPLVREFDNLFVTRSFSKYPGCAGIRLGYAVAARELISGLMSVRGGNEVSGPTLAIGCYLLDHPQIAEDFRAAVEEGRHILRQGAQTLRLDVLPCVTNFEFLRCTPEIDPAHLADALAERRYLVKSGFTHPSLAGTIRVSLNGSEVMSPFVQVLGEVVTALRKEQPVPVGHRDPGVRAGATET